MTDEESRDLADALFPVENVEEWIHCPHCESEDVEVKHFNPYSEYRPIVDCNNCPAAGFFE